MKGLIHKWGLVRPNTQYALNAITLFVGTKNSTVQTMHAVDSIAKNHANIGSVIVESV